MNEPRGTRRQRNAPTISDVAAKAGVSPMTVSRVINGETNVRAETRERVEAAIKALDYSPSSAARTLAGGEEIRIGLLHSNPSFNYLSQLLVGSLDQASRLNVQLIVEKCDDEAEEQSAVDHLIRARLDGIILTPPLSESLPVLEAIHQRNIPVVAVATGRAPDWALSVSINDHAAAYEMTRHLLTLGHARIGFIKGNPRQTASEERLQGYRDALSDAGLAEAPELVVQGLFTYRSGLDAAERLLGRKRPPTAIFASNDDMAAAVVSVAHRRHLDVPQQLTVVGFDDTTTAITMWPPLTTVHQPVRDLAAEALRLLSARVSGTAGQGPAAGDYLLDYHIVERESEGPPAAG
jgi:LacI family transcriptional regulator